MADLQAGPSSDLLAATFEDFVTESAPICPTCNARAVGNRCPVCGFQVVYGLPDAAVREWRERVTRTEYHAGTQRRYQAGTQRRATTRETCAHWLSVVGGLLVIVAVVAWVIDATFKESAKETAFDGTLWSIALWSFISGLPLLLLAGLLSPADEAVHEPVYKRKVVPANVKRAVYERDGGRCVSCGSQHQLQWDHDIPLSRGGSNAVENIQILCGPCNRKKSNKIA